MVRFTDMFTELVRLEIELWNGLDTHLLSKTGLSLPQFQALTAIRVKGHGARVQDISDEMSITVGATSKVVDRLERDGLALRSANPSDRRSSLVRLTPRGSTALALADDVVETHLRGVLGSTLPDNQVSTFVEALAAIRVHAPEQVTK
jgi:DNA-binding MarR family transcriptional regulator